MSQNANDEYENQFWGFTANELSSGCTCSMCECLLAIDRPGTEVKNVIVEYIQGRINHLYVSLQKKIPKEKWPVSECQMLLDECLEKSTEHINGLEAHIQENFKIPPHVLLEEDNVQRQQYSEDDKQHLSQEIEELKKKINKVHFMEFHLLQELERNKELNTISKKVQECSLPPTNNLPSMKKLHQIKSECLGLEVEEANCHLKDEDPEESNHNQPNRLLAVLKKKQPEILVQNL